jgi:hypothetical protein
MSAAYLRVARLAVVLVALLPVQHAAAGSLQWVWEDEFTTEEQAQVSRWLRQTHAAVERYGGSLLFPVALRIHRRNDAAEPVPWANTWRGQPQTIHFYIDPTFSEEEFLADWTAPHEFSHLLLPYLGRDNSWYAEGFASYLQHSVMVEMGQISEEEANRRRSRKINAAVEKLQGVDEPMLMRVSEMKRSGAYPTLYWGGALYFERVDRSLKKQGSSLRQVIANFVACCRDQRYSLDDLTGVLDRVGETRVFSDELAVMRTTPGLPARPCKDESLPGAP